MSSLRADGECVLGIVGRPVSLPCFSHELLNSVNVSIEWRRGDEVVLSSVWNQDGSVETWSVNSSAVPADAPLTGNLSLKLPAVRPVEDKIFYSLFMVSGENRSTRLCTACLRTAGQCRGLPQQAEGRLLVQKAPVQNMLDYNAVRVLPSNNSTNFGPTHF